MSELNSPTRNGIIEPSRDDIDAMHEIFKVGQIQHHEAFPEIFCRPDSEDKVRAYIESFLQPKKRFRIRRHPRRQFALARFKEDQLQGYIFYQLHKSSDIFFGENRWFAYVDDIAVSERFRKMGVASELLKALTDEVEALGGGIVSGQVWDQNTSSEVLFTKAKFEASAKQFYRVI